MNSKKMLHTVNRYFTKCCGILLLFVGGYSANVAFTYIDETIIKGAVVCFGVFMMIMGIKYLRESKGIAQ